MHAFLDKSEQQYTLMRAVFGAILHHADGKGPCKNRKRLGLARTMYVRCIYNIFGKEITRITVIYDVYIRFWPKSETTQQHPPCS